MSQSVQTPERPHPAPSSYVKVASILTVVTVVEVAIYYVSSLRGVLVPLFLALSATKFALVALFYMHLKFDNRLFSTFFIAGVFLAVAVALALLALFGVFRA